MRSAATRRCLPWAPALGIALALLAVSVADVAAQSSGGRVYQNRLTPIAEPLPILADHPDFVAPVVEIARFEAPPLIDEPGGQLHVRAWRYSYNARGIIEMPNRLLGERTALIVVHPWGIDDGQGWNTPQPAGVAFQCTPEKNEVLGRHIRDVLNPLLKSLRDHVRLVAYSLPGNEDPARAKLYRSFRRPTTAERRAEGERELEQTLADFKYLGEPTPESLTLSETTPVADYFRQFPGLDSGPRFNGQGFWDLPVPVHRQIEAALDDVAIYDAEGYAPLRAFLQQQGIRHVILAGYNTDMCVCSTTAGYENLSKDFNVFLVGDATVATFPANATPALATNAAVSFAALRQLITQASWIRHDSDAPSAAQ